MEKPLWAPWRTELLTAEKRDGCIFCLLPAEDQDRENLILARSARSFVILNRFPYNTAHLMVIPRRHVGDYTELSREEVADLSELLQLSITLLWAEYQPGGFNVGMNLGPCSGAGIAEHLHHHVVPRWPGDTNFMPVVGQIKVMIEHLKTSWDRLRPRFDAALSKAP
jgi:ATP adenylyltransferase